MTGVLTLDLPICTGLGLPIARRNVELSGGTIEVTSAKGRGTVVTLRLPISDSHLPEQTGEGEKGRPGV